MRKHGARRDGHPRNGEHGRSVDFVLQNEHGYDHSRIDGSRRRCGSSCVAGWQGLRHRSAHPEGYGVSIRGNQGVDVSEIAKKYGGGGHKGSAGFNITYGEELPWKLVEEDTDNENTGN